MNDAALVRMMQRFGYEGRDPKSFSPIEVRSAGNTFR